ncbi:MAG: flagellar biosynthesis protein FlgM, partial [Gemmatimonadetes bacterium]|nr:zinc metallopeptidase [Gemmatimonadota bacterium]NIQ56970.1 zinc metallopeptidase [Gemmatimonadota bacterium]NIU77141.1 flagellar biosynthesis protein FlgM [Gammaproteobacteria bacterium]NIX46462.1 flagellar biosynthesis protein FlgM [Gemmatimonadota bacterium]NIY10777.1 flagellar biosynthesis protein FlgM [Gemmatimonadota bacterium]
DTEDAWHPQFRALGLQYREPDLVLFRDAVRSACGIAGSAVGPFYCPRDARIYLDLSFFHQLASRFGAPGDFAQAYVIAHEVGHHVQNLLGISDEVQSRQQRSGRTDANALSVQLELQADCLAGVWGAHAAREDMLEPGDVEEGLRAAAAIGDDMIQRRQGGAVAPESFTHGTSEQRVRWFRRGLSTGDPRQCDTFAADRL